MSRANTRVVKIGDRVIGGGNPIAIQSMTNTKTEDVRATVAQILELEQDTENMDTINEIFRAAHSLKGMAGTMGYKRMQNLTHDMENVFSEVRNGNIKVKANLIDVLFQCLDALEEYLDNIKETADEGTNDNEPLIKQLNDILTSKGEGAAPAEKQSAAPVSEKAAAPVAAVAAVAQPSRAVAAQ